MQRSFQFAGRIRSFKYAARGLLLVLRSQHNAWIHAAATGLVNVLGIWFQLSREEWLWIVLSITLVWLAEAFNTAVEFLADAITQERHPLIGHAKDVAAGAVLVASLGAVAIAGLVFIPHLCGHGALAALR